MKKIFLSILLICVALGSFCQPSATHKIIVKLKTGKSFANENIQRVFTLNNYIKKVAPFAAAAKAKRVLQNTDLVKNIYFLEFDAAKPSASIVKELAATGMFEYVEEDKLAHGGGVEVTPNDTYYNRQWGFKNDGTFDGLSTAGADVSMPQAWEITTGSPSTVVCVLDCGLKLDHPEFAGRLWVNENEIPGNGIDDDANGYIDDVNGWDFANNDYDPTDDYGHGTNVAGILAANANNNDGYAGVNWSCKMMTGKVLDATSSGSYTWITDGVIYAVANGAQVINMSLGGSSFSQALKDACDFAYANNVTILACMMNTNSDEVYYPAGFESTIAVGATNTNDYRVSPFPWSATSGSNFGPHIEIVAPGNFIYGLSYSSNTYYSSYWSGTSQATPLVAGVVSLMYGLKPNITVAQVRDILTATAQDGVGNPAEDVPGFDPYMGYGRMNAAAALSSLLLPLKIGALTGKLVNGSVNLYWQTNNEQNINYFNIEFSDNLISWIETGKVSGKGNSSTAQNYNFAASQKLTGTLYYRLHIIEKDGKHSYSNICKFSAVGNSSVRLQSSIVTNKITLVSQLNKAEILACKVYTTDGKQIIIENKLFDKGIFNATINFANKPAGIYIVQVAATNGEVLFSGKFIKQ